VSVTPARWSRVGQQAATIGLFLYSAFAPHSIAAAEISLAIVGAGWLVRTIFSRKTGFHPTRFDLPIWLFFLWSAASSFLSQEPRISIAKIQSTCVIFLFYLTQAIVTRRTAVLLVAVMILSGAAGGIVLASIGYAIAQAISDRPERTFLFIAIAALVISFALPIRLSFSKSHRFAGVTPTAQILLVLMHTIVATIDVAAVLAMHSSPAREQVSRTFSTGDSAASVS